MTSQSYKIETGATHRSSRRDAKLAPPSLGEHAYTVLTIAGLMPRPTAEHVGGSVRRGEAKIPSSSKGKNLQIIPQAANARLLSYRTLNDAPASA